MYVPLLFVRYVIRCPLVVGSVPLPFVSVPLPFVRFLRCYYVWFRYYVCVPLLCVFRYYVYIPLLFVRYVIRCPLLVGSVPLPFVSVPLPLVRYYVSVTIYPKHAHAPYRHTEHIYRTN